MSLIRAIFAWVVIFALLLLLASTFGLIGMYEFWILFVVSIGATVLALRFWDRWHAGRAQGTHGP